MIIKNMKILLPFLIGVMVWSFAITPVKSDLMNFTSTTVLTPNFNASSWGAYDKIDMVYYNGDWYVSASQRGTRLELAKFNDYNMSDKEFGSTTFSDYLCDSGGTAPCKYVDWNLINGQIEMFGTVSGKYSTYWYVDLDDFQYHTRGQESYATGSTRTAYYGNDGTVFFRIFGATSNTRNISESGQYLYNYTKTWHLPENAFPKSTAGSIEITIGDLHYESDNKDYYLVFLNSTNDKCHGTSSGITCGRCWVGVWGSNFGFNDYNWCSRAIDGSIMSIGSYLDGTILYTVAVNTSNIARIMAFDTVNIHFGQWLRIDEQVLNLTDYESSINATNLATAIGLSRDDKGRFALMFAKNTSLTTSPTFYLMYESSPCFCSDWVNASCLTYNYRQQVRQCNRFCVDSLEVQSVVDTSCEEEYKPYDETVPEQRKKQKCFTGGCLGEWAYPLDVETDMESECYLDAYEDHKEDILRLNETVEVNYSISVHTERYSFFGSGGRLGDRKFGLYLCNPLDDCAVDGTRYLCESQANMTQTAGRIFNVSDTFDVEDLQFGYVVAEGKQCAMISSVGLFDQKYGWERYRVSGSYSICGYMYCGNRRVCEHSGLKMYSTVEMVNCKLNRTSRIECTSGKCEDGVCVEALAGEIRSPSGNPFEWIMSEAEYNLGSTVTMVFAFGISLGGGIYSVVLTKKWQMGAIGMMGLVALFMSIGWLPAIIGVLWILSIAVILMKGLFFKGE